MLEVLEAVARAPRGKVSPRFVEMLPGLLDEADADRDPYTYYQDYAELFAHAQTWEPLGILVRRALEHADEDVREIGQNLADEYGPLVTDPSFPRPR